MYFKHRQIVPIRVWRVLVLIPVGSNVIAPGEALILYRMDVTEYIYATVLMTLPDACSTNQDTLIYSSKTFYPYWTLRGIYFVVLTLCVETGPEMRA